MMGVMPFIAPAGGSPLTLFADVTGTNYPSGLQNGDFGILMELDSEQTNFPSSADIIPVAPGFTSMAARQVQTSQSSGGSEGTTTYTRRAARISGRSLTAALSGASIGSGAPSLRRLLVFRHPAARTIELITMRTEEQTNSYAASISFAAQPAPILPIFAIADAGDNVQQSLTFDGAAPTFFDLNGSTLACARIGVFMGAQSPRSIAFNMGAGSNLSHAIYNLRGPLA